MIWQKNARWSICVLVAMLAVVVCSLAPPVSSTSASEPLGAATEVAAGRGSSCAIVADEVYCWGANNAGQLGNGSTGRELEPVKVDGLDGPVEIRVGDDHACALLADTTMRCWGANSFGQLGDGTTVPSSTPVAVPGLTGVTAIAAGRQHTCAVLADTTVRCWGLNNRGQLGNGATPQDLPATPAPPPQLNPTPVLGVGGVGRLDGVVQIEAADAFHTCALLSSGEVRCWGWDQYGQLGHGVQNATADSDRAASTPQAVVGMTDAVRIAVVGAGNSCALLAGGEVRCWGWNTFGQLGQGGPTPGVIGNTSHSATPVAVLDLPPAIAITETSGTGQVCAIVEGGQLYCWGHNGLGQLGDGSNAHHSLPVVIPTMDHVTQVSGGADHTCAVHDGLISCWGYNNEGQLGDGLTINRTVPTLVEFVERPFNANAALVPGISTATAVGTGAQHACAIIAGGKVACWGDNRRGQLGDGAFGDRSTPVVVSGIAGATALAVGGDHTCAAVSGEVRCWGWNGVGQLGDGTFVDRPTPVTVPGLNGVTAVAAGRSHTCAVVAGGEVRCWGHNYVGGPIGAVSGSQGGPIFSASPIAVPTVQPPVPPLAGATAASIRGGHTCVVLADTSARCWGFGTDGQLGTGTFQAAGPIPLTPTGLSGVAAIAAGATHTCALIDGGDVRCWGQNVFGQVGDGTTSGRNAPTSLAGLTGATAIAAGADHTCAVVGGGVRCWGWNGSGQLGDGTTDDALSPVVVNGLSGVTAVSAGWRTSCALLAGGTVSCWGLTLVEPVACSTVISGTHDGSLEVSGGTTCLASGSKVVGPITVLAGARLVADGARVTGPLTADGAVEVRICGTKVTGRSTLNGGISVTLGDPDVGCAANQFTGPVKVMGAAGPSVIAGNQIVGPLSCSGNALPPANNGHPNSVTGPKSGQCAQL